LLRQDPSNALRHDAVAMLYLQSGRAAEAAAEYRRSLELNPESAPAYYNLGLALSMQQQFEQAAAAFRDAVRLAPDYAEAHNNLGAMLHVFGRLDEAADHYRRAVTLRPDNAEAENNLARVLAQQGRQAEALDHFRRALALNGEHASALSGLAWIRATSPEPLLDPTEALRLAERADTLTGHREPSVLDVLAAAYASAGRFDRAESTARLALQAANAAGLSNLAREIQDRLRLYERNQPFRIIP
jgi:Flp pilus assembly protein TadD